MSGGSLDHALQNSIVQPSAFDEALTQRHFGAHGDPTISPSRLRPTGTNEWNAGDPTLPYELSLHSYPSFPEQPTSLLPDSSGGRNRANTSSLSDSSLISAPAARARDNSYLQGQRRA